MSASTATYTGEASIPSGISLPTGSFYPGSIAATTDASSTSCSFFVTALVTAGGNVNLTFRLPAAAGQTLPTTFPFAQIVLYSGSAPISIPTTVSNLKIISTANSPSTTTASSSGGVNLTSNSVPSSSAATPVTTTAPTITSISPSPTYSIHHGPATYSAGGLAGVAVGCLLGGVFLATLATCLFMRRKKRRHNGLLAAGSEKSPPHGHGEAVYLAGSKSWEGHVPQSESDGTIRSMANRTLDQIAMYVENFYHDTRNVHLLPEVQSKIVGLNSPHLPSAVMNLIPHSTRPTVLIKHCIANLIVSRITVWEAAEASFLPKNFGGQQPSLAAQRKPGFTQALSTWRVLTAYLWMEPERDIAYQNERDASIEDAARLVCQAFEPWARSADDARFHSLVGIMQRASDLGMTIFSQPSGFLWEWEAQGRSAPNKNDLTKVVVSPGLYKITDQEARPLSFPICLIEPGLGALTRS